MRIKYRYNHLHAEEYLYYRKEKLIVELEECLKNVDANKFLKISCAKPNLGEIFYDQKALNAEIENRLGDSGWKELKTSYYVTGDEATTKEVVKISDKEEQKRIIEERGFIPLLSHNQVDFLKERIAVEVQFGKYFSVAYDLHVKHTFFFLRDDIDVGIEIIPTHKMMDCMDTGVAWFENEVTNVIREGRNNPTVPVYILGIESDDMISKDPNTYTDAELGDIIKNSDKEKLKNQMKKAKAEDQKKWDAQIEKAKNKLDALDKAIDDLNGEYSRLKDDGYADTSKEIQDIQKKIDQAMDKKNTAQDKYSEVKATPPLRLKRIKKLEPLL